MKRLASFLTLLLTGLLWWGSANAQTAKRLVFVDAVAGTPQPTPPPLTNPAALAAFVIPGGVAMGASATSGSLTGTIYVADPAGQQVVVFPPTGGFFAFHTLTCPTAVHGCFGASTWRLNSPTNVATASNGNIWISDTGNDVVVQITPTGTVVQFAGVGPIGMVMGCALGIGCPANPNAGSGAGQFFGPGSLAVDGSDNLYVVDGAGDLVLNRDGEPLANFRIEKFNKNGTFLTSWGSLCILDAPGHQAPGTPGTCNTAAPGAVALGDGQLGWTGGIAVDNAGAVYVTDVNNNTVQKFTPTGRFLRKWGGLPFGSGDGQFSMPAGIAVDLDQTIYVTDLGNNRIQEFTTDGAFIGKGGSLGSGEAQFTRPVAIAAVPTGMAFNCLFASTLSDCLHGMLVSENTGTGTGNRRVQFLAGRIDTDGDGITDEVDASPNAASTAITNASLGFDTTGTVVTAGDQTFTIYNVLSPAPVNLIRVQTETTGGVLPVKVAECGGSALVGTAAGGAGFSFHCSTPTMAAEKGPVGFEVTGSDGTGAAGTLQTGDSVSWDPHTSKIQDNAGSFGVSVGGKTISLTPGQTAFADSTPPTTTATQSAYPNRHYWFPGTVAVTLSATDNQGGSGVKSVTYSLSGAQPGAGTVPGNSTTVVLQAEGVTTLSYFATDNAGNEATAKAMTVQIDKTPPRLLCKATPAFLKLAEGMAPVTLSVTVEDWLSGAEGFLLTSVRSNHDQHVDKDIEGFKPGTASVSGSLRAEKGRMYTFQYTGTDQAGNADTCTVKVPVVERED